jgi:pterin-4a-carbinolamine dehydratase
MSSKSEQDNHRSAYKPRADPTAKRPTQKCDPYGQGGKPMSKAEAKLFKSTTHEDWKLEFGNTDYPIAIFREFVHSDFLLGARFLQKIAAVAELNAHFPSICLERRIVKKNWQVFSRIRCHTRVLEGLSANDFHLAMVRFPTVLNLHVACYSLSYNICFL